MKYQCCPVCDGRAIDPWVVGSTSVPTRFSHPCHRCNGTGTILEYDAEPRCTICGKTAGWFGLHLLRSVCSEPADQSNTDKKFMGWLG